jgi:hypothetical protein
MPAAAKATTPIARIIDQVKRAQAAGGGWLQILIHHVCERCHPYSTSESDLRRLLAWLDARDGVRVRTVGQLLDRDGPTVAITEPALFSSGSREVTISTQFAAQRVRRIRFFSDGKQIGVKTVKPWRVGWDANSVRPGTHVLQVLLEDHRGNTALSRPVLFDRTDPSAR